MRAGMVSFSVRVYTVVALTVCVLAVSTPTEAGPIALNTSATSTVESGATDRHSSAAALSSITNLVATSSVTDGFGQFNWLTNFDGLAVASIVVSSGSLSLGVQTLSDVITTLGAGGLVSSESSTTQGQAHVSVTDGLTIVGGPTTKFGAEFRNLWFVIDFS